MIRRIPALVLVGLALASAGAPPAAARSPSVLVEFARLEKGSLPRTVTAYGTVRAGPAARETVMAPLAAIIGAIYVRPGEQVARGTPLVRLGPSPATQAAYRQAQSSLALASELVTRTAALLRQHLATGQQLAAAQKSEAYAHAALAALVAEGAQGPQILRAPYRAIVTSVAASPGAIVAAGAPLVGLAQPSGLVLEVGVVPSRAAAIKPGQPVKIVPLGATDAVSGKVLLRSAVVNRGTGLVPVEIGLPPNVLLSGEMAEAQIVTGQSRGYVVPHSAILVDDSGAPYVVQAVNMVARQVPVRVVATGGARDVVEGALDPSAPLVLSGNYQLKTGMRVRVQVAGPEGSGPK